MVSQQFDSLQQSQRVRVEMEPHLSGMRVKILVESHDERLGWYPAGTLTVPLEQLPLLEQAVEEMRRRARSEESSSAKVIPFPGPLARENCVE
ncbi:MAG: hypothetical protein AB1813_03855 [Verrucomicrobiota bacterium]